MTEADLSVLTELKFKEYDEVRDSQLCRGRPITRPTLHRWQTVIYHFQGKKWWININLHGMNPFATDAKPPEELRKRERQAELQQIIKKIDFRSLKHALLDDTVTELVLNDCSEEPGAANQYVDLTFTSSSTGPLRNVRCRLREDPLRVKYPPASRFPSFKTYKFSDLEPGKVLTDRVMQVYHRGDQAQYILKVVHCSSYRPHHTDMVEKELENLELFRGVSGIIQPVGIAVFPNPYTTSGTPQTVIGGIVMEFHGGGCLKNILRDRHLKGSNWKRWPLQIGTALDTMHRANKTHMDLKPSHIVIDKDGNAVIIDISGIGGVTHRWQAPEIRDEESPLDLPFETRRLNDVWAFGMILQEFMAKTRDIIFARALSYIVDGLTDPDRDEWTLSRALVQLKKLSS